MPCFSFLFDRLFIRYKSEFKVWKSDFFMLLSISFTLMVFMANKLKEIGMISLFSMLAALFAVVLMIFYRMIYSYKKYYGESSITELFPFAAFLLINIVFVIRVIDIIVIPYHEAQYLYDKEMIVEGKIISFINDRNGGSAFSNDILEMNHETEKSSDTDSKDDQVLLKTKYGIISFYDTSHKLRYGDHIRTALCFTKPSPLRNPGGFDEIGYLQSNGIYLKGSLTEDVRTQAVIMKSDWICRAACSARSKIIRIFMKNLPVREAALMSGLLIGDRSKMSGEDIMCFQKAGLSHITAVSGSAITFLLLPVNAIFKKIKISKKVKSCTIIAMLAFFGFMTGWSPSISRALTMVFIIIFAKENHIKVTVVQSLLISISILVFINPVFALNIGFWLSGMATAGIVQLSGSIEKIVTDRHSSLKTIGSALSTGIAAGISVMPFAIWISGEISLSSIISNILILPVVGFATVLGSLQTLAGVINENYFMTNLLALPLKGLLFLIYSFSRFIGGINFLRIYTHMFSFLVFLSICVFVAFIFVKSKRSKRFLRNIAICLLISGLVHTMMIRITQPGVRIIFADVAQGDATLIIMKTGESILIDSGGRLKGAPVMERMLDFYNIGYPTIYINTHTHEDHCGGMIELLRKRGGKTLFLPYDTIAGAKSPASYANASSPQINGESNQAYELLQTAYDKNVDVKEIGENDIINIRDKLKIIFYSPGKHEESIDKNNDSCLVMKIEYEDYKILIMGDASGDAEKELISKRFDLDSDIYRISHHGSPSGTNNDIISAVSPKISIISVGKNFYGHPSPKVIERLSDAGSLILRTDLNGAAILEISDRKLLINTMIPQRGF